MRFLTVLALALAVSASNVARADDVSASASVASSSVSSSYSSSSFSFPTTITESDGFTCPIPNFFATAQQVINTRIAALQAGDINGVMCTYGVGATVVMAGSVITGRPAIQSAFISFFSILGNTIPTFTSQTYAGPIALITYTVSTPSVTLSDGSDTFVIELGRIRYHTVSGTLQFH